MKTECINEIAIKNGKRIIRNCLFCKDPFETTVGGARICPKKKCQNELKGISNIRVCKFSFPISENKSVTLP